MLLSNCRKSLSFLLTFTTFSPIHSNCHPTQLLLILQVTTQKLEWKAESKIGSLDNATHKPVGGAKKIETKKLDFKEKATSKIGSLQNATHKPAGGNVKVKGAEKQ